MDFMHYHLDTTAHSPSSVAKRDRSRLMDRCADFGHKGWVFEKSNCMRNGNLRSLTVHCSDGTYVRILTQSCTADELCVDTGEGWHTKAYCVPMDNFFRIPTSGHRRVTGDFERHIPTRDHPHAAQALLVDQFRRHGLSGAENFELSAIKETVPQRLVLESVRCVDCYRLGLEPLPANANLLRASLDIYGALAGYLYLVTIS